MIDGEVVSSIMCVMRCAVTDGRHAGALVAAWACSRYALARSLVTLTEYAPSS